MTQRERYLEEIREEVKRSIAKAKSEPVTLDTSGVQPFALAAELFKLFSPTKQVMIVHNRIGNGWTN
jgi:hypothetical protein